MKFKTPITVSLSVLKEFLFEAKRQGFAATDTKTTLTDQTSVYSYRAFNDRRFAGMIYTDTYGGNIVEGGQESVTIDLALRWRNQNYGGTREAFWDIASRAGLVKNLDSAIRDLGPRFPQLVTAFLKQSLMHLTPDFPVRGPRTFRASEVEFEDARFPGDWTYANYWEAVPLFDTEDPFASYTGHEHISLNGIEVFWHAYHGGLVRDKYFPFVLQPT